MVGCIVKIFYSICLVFSFFCPSLSYAFDANLSTSEQCLVARKEAVFLDEIFPLSESIKQEIFTYKKRWVDFCDKKNDVTLAELLSLGKTLGDHLEFGLFNNNEDELDWEKIEEYFLEKIMLFLPAFEGEVTEYNYYHPKMTDFSMLSQYGSNEDKNFFQLYQKFYDQSILPSWYDQTWDYGGCLKFGEFNWIDAFNDLNKLKHANAIIYRQIADNVELNLKETLEYLYTEDEESGVDICTCSEKESVKEDLLKISAYLDQHKQMPDLIKKLDTIIDRINKGKISIPSYKKNECKFG